MKSSQVTNHRGRGRNYPGDAWLSPADPPPQFDMRLWKPTLRCERIRKKFETLLQGETRRDSLAGVLENGDAGHHKLGRQLRHCWDDTRCGLPCCPLCLRQFRIHLVHRAARHLRKSFSKGTLRAVTLVAAWGRFAPGELHLLSERDLKQELLDTLRSAGLDPYAVIGGPDISFNEHSGGLWESHWQVHWHLLFADMDLSDEQFKGRLRPYFPMTDTIPRPMKVETVDDLLGAISYVYKSFFERRVSYIDSDGHKNTRSALPLKAGQQRELALALSNHTFTDRLFLRGFRRRGQRLVRT